MVAVTIFVIGLALRVPIMSVSPLLEQLSNDLNLTSAAASLLTTLAVLCFGLLAPLAPVLAGLLGLEVTIVSMLGVIAGGMVVRSLGDFGIVLAGTVILGGGIAVLNVLMPGMVKRDHASRAGLLMSIYSVALTVGPTLAAVASIPLAVALGGWRPGLAVWAAVPLAGMVLAVVTARGNSRPSGGGEGGLSRLMRQKLAWQVTLQLGLQSLLLFSIAAWLPTLLMDAGLTQTTASLAFGFFSVTGVIGSMSGPLLANRSRSQSWLAFPATGMWLIGLLGLVLIPDRGTFFWTGIMGVGSGLNFSVALTMLVLRSPDVRTAGQLSGMAHTFGYILAAAGPLVFGWLHDVTGSWQAPLYFLILILPVVLWAGAGAGRPRLVGPGTDVTAGKG